MILNEEKRTVTFGETAVKFSKKKWQIVTALFAQPGAELSLEKLNEIVGGGKSLGRVHIHGIRQKLKGHPATIKTQKKSYIGVVSEV